MKKAQPRPWAFPAEHTTEMSPLKRISEQVREKYMPIGTEVPYVFKQHTRKIEFEPSGNLMVHHEIVVRKNSQKVWVLIAHALSPRAFSSRCTAGWFQLMSIASQKLHQHASARSDITACEAVRGICLTSFFSGFLLLNTGSLDRQEWRQNQQRDDSS